MPVSSQTSRGDLLRWMHRFSKDEEEKKRLTASILGYELPELKTIIVIDTHNPPDDVDDKKKEELPNSPNEQRPPELFYALTERERYATPETQDKLLVSLQGLEPLQDEDLQAFADDVEPLPWQPILPMPRLANFLRESLAYNAGQQLDVAKLVKQVANLKILLKLPRKPRVLPAGRVIVLVDLNKRLRPFWRDAHDLCQLIARKHGRNGLDIRVIDNNPQDGYCDWFDQKQQTQPWRCLQGNSVVFIISDLGQLAVENSPIQRQWLAFIRRLQHQNIQPLVLSPLSVAQQDSDLHKTSRQILWNKHSRLVPQKPNNEKENHQQSVERVLGLLSIAAHVEPELLRAILSCLPAHEADSGIEAAVWLHKDVQWGYTAIRLQPDKRVEYQDKFKQESSELQRQVLALLQRHHAGQFRGVWAEELLNAQPLIDSTPTAMEADLKKAELFMQRFTSGVMVNNAPEDMAQYARRHLQRLGPESKHHYRNDYTSALYGLAYQQQLLAGQEIPQEYDWSIVQAMIGEKTEPTTYTLMQLGEQLVVSPANKSVQGLQIGSVLAEFETVSDRLLLTCDLSAIGQPSFNYSPSLKDNEALGLNGQTITLDSGFERLVIAPAKKPGWAYKIGRHPNGLLATLRFANDDFNFLLQVTDENEILNEKAKWQPINSFGSTDSQHFFSIYRKSTGTKTNVSIGFDDYGLYADLTLLGVTQRFRWLEPGTFLMGSPNNEPEREWPGEGEGSETQHQVTLTQGFWLADTTVTQAFWQAVMANNPSNFKDDPNNPVQQVSWQDAQDFISKLNSYFPGLQAQLPSEAQWEYACRAGTTTPFSFGDNITPEHVNYDGNYPYNNGQKGLYREKTIAVKSLPPNPWGLYEMHGNVWEWCEDAWQSALGDDPVIDPMITSDEAVSPRVIRGGSWNVNGMVVRSAIRGGDSPGSPNYDLGFRLALAQHIKVDMNAPIVIQSC